MTLATGQQLPGVLVGSKTGRPVYAVNSGSSGAPGPPGPPGTNPDAVVKVTSLSTTSGMYPGVVQISNNPAGNPATWTNGATCWVIGDNAETLALQRYNGFFLKDVSSVPVFSTVPPGTGGGSLTVIDAETLFSVSSTTTFKIGWGYVSSAAAGEADVLYSGWQQSIGSPGPLIPTATLTPVQFTNNIGFAVFSSPDFGAVQGTNLAQITVPANGLYDVGVCVQWNTNSSGTIRELLLYMAPSGGGFSSVGVGDDRPPPPSGRGLYQSMSVRLSALNGATFEWQAYQDSGSNIQILQGLFWVRKVG
jgi:hypothetical protein